ncbi:MAG TPA: protein kinase [Pyrinomonadaceae bacterium]|jgi:serine/threonine protein kinase|nr:protein kinase [Pyrinomonadaceae bacterium]
MSLSPNTTLAHYTIVSKIGAGGMGEVYRARDTRLDREVAIKLLLEEVSGDSDRLERFEQEARATSALNHPNILTVYDTGTHEGSPYIVTELLEGEELRDRLETGPIPLRKVIDYAQQIVNGLSAAHEKGIIHRDLKPENLFITKDDRAKILDFGLAKLRGNNESLGSEDATRRAITNPGVVMGTVGYMSPEQVRGQLADHRSDIFSFGAILHEMITGRRAFRRETMAESMSAILKEEPEELTQSNPNVSPALDRIVRRCLEKKPERRFQSTSDLGFALESLSASSSSTGSSTISLPEVATEPESQKPIRRPFVYALGFILLIGGIIAGMLGSRLFRQTSMPNYEQLTFRRGFVYHARFAPDGQTIVYSGEWNGHPSEIFSTRAGLSESRSLGLTNADVLAISSTGEMAVLLKRQFMGQLIRKGTLARVPMIGGTPREILEDVQEADWSPDGKDLAVVRYVDGRNRLEYPIGKVLYETAGYISYPRISPKGGRIAFMDHALQWDNRGRVAVVDLGGTKTIISEEYAGEEGVAWSPSGDEVWFTASTSDETNSLFASTLSGNVRLVLRVPADLTLHDITRDGHVLLTRFKQSTDLVGFTPGEAAERDISWLDMGGLDDLSADGKTFIFSYWGQGSGTNYSMYLGKTDGSPAIRLGDGGRGKLSPDGKWVLALLSQPSQIVFLPTAAGEMRRMEQHGIEQYNEAAWLPDGKRIVFLGRESGHLARCYVQTIESGGPRPITPEGVEGRFVSPDGQSLVAFDKNGQAAIYSVDRDDKPRPISGLTSTDAIARWSGDGQSLYVYSWDNMSLKVFRLNLATGRKELLKEVTPPDRAGIFYPPTMILTPDGKGYVYSLRRVLMELFLVDGLK